MTNLTSNMAPETFSLAIKEKPEIMTDILSDKEKGSAFFRFADEQASSRFKLGWQEITRAILWLDIIRQHDLWKFGEFKNWTNYLDNWIENGARERTRVRDALSVIRMWTGPNTNREPSELVLFEEGIASVEPIFSGDRSPIAKASDGGYNPRTGEILKLKPEWEGKLVGNTPGEQINSLVDELPKSTTKTQTRDMLRNEIPKADCKFFPCYKNGVCYGYVAHFYDKDGGLVREVTVECPEFWDTSREVGLESKHMSMFRFPMEWRNG